ncbi:Fe-S oxidoreductase [Desulfitobacterium dehalogenans ATCC 51507]|uniref:Fe-S oxidoreductase n=1 Tax=Desulfitobacterium dehalogenans (strain ATCC 51507 / DSM 9161 / JW/IU-DC1) TaxID=756499 RepID=I4A959_DESDJ|nr:radical SAM protein [Desulfitobacterium dehalogenans]AFM00494.1 Fe-S oxidoreductase [Desulfitobacterium dehalogenans ATCC 51507]
MIYEGAVFRPPSEASSLILQVTLGCRHNQCTFCSMYKGKSFRIRSIEEIMTLIDAGYRAYPHTERIFLADGDALAIETDVLAKVLKALYQRFSRLKRVGIYGGPKDILEKGPEELALLKEQGLSIVYLGVESGCGTILNLIHKGVTPEEMINAGQRIVASGLKLSCTIILGLGGKEHSQEHAVETGKVISAIDPHYLGALTLMLAPDAPLIQKIQSGEFTLLSKWESLIELELMVQGLNLKDCLFRSNHASNYLPLKAHLPHDKEVLLSTLKEVIEDNREEALRPEYWRGL